MDQNNFAISFNEIIKLVINGFIVALSAAIIVGTSSYLISRTLPKQFEARATVLAANSSPDTRSFGIVTPPVPALDVSAYRKAVLSSPVLRNAMTSLGLGEQTTQTIESFKKSIKIHTEAARDSSLIDIITSEASAELAQAKANALANALVIWDRGRATENLQRIIITLEQQLAVFDNQLASLREQGAASEQIESRLSLRSQQQDQLAYAKALLSSANGLLSVIEPALLPISPVAPRPLLNAFIAALISAILSYALLHLKNSLGKRQERLSNPLEQSGLSVLASFAEPGEGKIKIANESMQFLRTHLLFSADKSKPKTILITSPQEVRNKSNVALSLAENFAKNNSYTLLVDANLREPAIARLYGMPAASLRHASFSSWLKSPGQSQDVVKVAVGDHTLFVIPGFKEANESPELLNNFEKALEKWQKEYEVIIIDAAPVLKVADSLAMAPYCSDTVLVVDEEESNLKDLQAAEQSLKRLKVNLAGLVKANSKEQTLHNYQTVGKATRFGQHS